MRRYVRGSDDRLLTITILLAMVLGAWLSLPGAVEADILVIDPSAGTGLLGALFRVDPTTGNRTLLSDFGNAGQGPLGSNPLGVAVSSPAGIPTLSEWAQIGMVALLVGGGLLAIRKRSTLG